MAHFPLLNCKILLGTSDLSGDMNSVTINRSRADLVDDTFGAAPGSKTMRSRINGLGDGVIGMAGLTNLADDGQDEVLSGNMSLIDKAILVALGGVDIEGGSIPLSYRCKFGSIMQGQYQSGGNVGGRAEWSAEGRISSGVLTDGWVMNQGSNGPFSGAWTELGAVSATQRAYGALFILANPSTTIVGSAMQSADDSFGTNPTDRIAFTTPITPALTFAQIVSVAGPITQTWWRFKVTSNDLAGSGTSFYYAAFGIM